MPGMDWDKARNDVRCAERGIEPVWGPGPPPRRPRTPAPLHVRSRTIGRLRDEFAALSYAQQLAELAPIRERLMRLFGDEDDAQRTVEQQFKPLLRKPKPSSAGRVVRLPPATRPERRRPRPGPAAASGAAARSNRSSPKPSTKPACSAAPSAGRRTAQTDAPRPKVSGRAATALSASASARAAVERAASAPPARKTRKQRAADRRAGRSA